MGRGLGGGHTGLSSSSGGLAKVQETISISESMAAEAIVFVLLDVVGLMGTSPLASSHHPIIFPAIRVRAAWSCLRVFFRCCKTRTWLGGAAPSSYHFMGCSFYYM